MSIILFSVAIVVLPFAVYMSLSLTAALARVKRAGAAQTREFRRAGVHWQSFLKARVRRQDSGSLIPTRAGVSLRSTAAGLELEETRTIAKDVF